ncbi:flagellin [Burkholderia multivorans]|nr:flagellin [Burkholderia multivorans]PRF49336.1 flagellin [Burkholderia multivorans]PRG46915.1 flagellin [Burkholderia multivorans]
MLGINSNINSLVAQQNLNGSQNALSQAITRLSSGKRINSAADDAAGLAIATRMQTQINGLNQGVSNANDGVSMIQTASSGLSQITSSLQRIRQLAVQASSGSLSTSDQQALQQEVTQQIAEVNRIASQTNYNGKNVLDGSAGNISFQVGANVGQTISLNLSQSLSAASLGKGLVSAGSTLGTLNNLSLDANGNSVTSGAAITAINVLSDGNGGFTYTDQNNQALSAKAVKNLFGNSTGVGGALNITASGSGSALLSTSQLSTISQANATPPAGTNTVIGTITGLSIDASTGKDVAAGTQGAITSITVKTNGSGGFNFYDQTGAQLSTGLVGDNSGTNPGSLLTITKGTGGNGDSVSFTNSVSTQLANVNAATASFSSQVTAVNGAVTMALPSATTTLGKITGLNVDTSGKDVAAGTPGAITSLTVTEDTSGNIHFADQNGTDVTATMTAAGTGLFDVVKGNGTTTKASFAMQGTATAPTISGTGTITGLSLDASGNNVAPGTQGAITSITVKNTGGTLSYTDQNGADVSSLFTGTAGSVAFKSGVSPISYSAPQLAAFSSIDANNAPGTVSSIDISTTTGANQAMESIDNALATVNNIQASLGAAQNRFTAISSTQQAQSTNLSQAQSQIQDANFAQETANLSKAQVLQQAGISVLAQANSLPQQVLKLLQ